MNGAGRALGHFPIKSEQVGQIHHTPTGWRRRPSAFKTGRDRVLRMPLTTAIFPTETLFFEAFTGRLHSNTLVGLVCTMPFPKGMATGNESNSLCIIHGHTTERLANVLCGKLRVGRPVGAFGIHINKTHLNGGKRVIEFALSRVTLIRKHHLLRPPVDQIRLPVVRTSARKAKCFKTHVFHRHITGENHEIGPTDVGTVRFLNRP